MFGGCKRTHEMMVELSPRGNAAAFAKACERSEVVPIGGHRMATHAPLIDEMR
jgi:hypothetical protein